MISSFPYLFYTFILIRILKIERVLGILSRYFNRKICVGNSPDKIDENLKMV